MKGKKILFQLMTLSVVVAFVVSAGFSNYQGQMVNNMPSTEDNYGFVKIADTDTPLSDIKVTTTTKTKTTTKKVTLKKKAKKTYTKKLTAKVKTSINTEEEENAVVETKETVKTQITEKYKKKSKKKTVTTKVTTTTTVTTTPEEVAGEQAEETTGAENSGVISTEEPISTEGSSTSDGTVSNGTTSNNSVLNNLAPLANDNVISAYENLGFKVVVNKSVLYAGKFDPEKRTITLKTTAGKSIYHELGHFVSFAAGNVDMGSTFKEAYNDEKSEYDGEDPSYMTGTTSEYFAASYQDYVEDPEALQEERPETYAVIETAVNRITDSQVKKLKLIYSSVWN